MDEPEIAPTDGGSHDKPSRHRARVLLWSAIVLAILFTCGWLALYTLYYFTVLSARISVTVDNQSGEPLRDAKVFIQMTGGTLIDLGDINPNAKVSRSVRFNRDLGPATFVAMHGKQSFRNRMAWVLLTDNGPFEHTFTVQADKIHWKSYAGSKGEVEGDFQPDSRIDAP